MYRLFPVGLACILCCACALSNSFEQRSAFKSVRLTLCRSVRIQDGIVYPRDETGKFSPYDQEVIAHLAFNDLSGSSEILWEWSDPSGHPYHADKTRLQISRGKYVEQATAWHPLTIRGDTAGSLPGQWKVQVFLDGRPLLMKPFIILEPSKVMPPPPIVIKPSSNRWGLIVGIEAYSNLGAAAYADHDARMMKEYYEKVLGVPEKHILFLLDQKATKDAVEGAVEKWLPANVQPGGTVFVYFSGHGAPDKSGEPHLIPWDADTRLGTRGYKLVDFYKALNKLPARRVFVFLDACFSGTARGTNDPLVRQRAQIGSLKEPRLDSQTVIAMSATSKVETGLSYDEAEYGLFTFYLLRALGGAADANGDRTVTVREAFDYVNDNVTLTAHREGKTQNPEIMPSIGQVGEIKLCETAPPPIPSK